MYVAMSRAIAIVINYTKQCDTYRTAQNFGGENFSGEFSETNAIRQYFTQQNSRFTNKSS